MRTLATFETDLFNTSETREYFINPECYGDDACRWLMERLRAMGVVADGEPAQEDFGWYFGFAMPEGRHCCVVVFRPGADAEAGVWLAFVERDRSLLGSLLGGRRRGVTNGAVAALHAALSAPEIRNLLWHERAEFERGNETGSSQL